MKKRAKKKRVSAKRKRATKKPAPRPHPDEVSEEVAAKIERIIAKGLERLKSETPRLESASKGNARGAAITREEAISERDLKNLLSKQYNVPSINLGEFAIDPEVIKLVARATCVKHGLMPVNRAGSTLIVAMADPSDINAIADLKSLTGFHIEVVAAAAAAIREAIVKYYGP